MARINIEDDFWVDVAEVAAKIGDQDVAIGMSLRFFRYAQEKHKCGRLLNEQEFAEKFNEALIPTFAKRTPSGIQAVGAEKHFGWLEQKVRAGAAGGRKSAQRPRNARGQLVAKSKLNQATTKHSQASSSSSSSSSDSSSPSSLVTEAPSAPAEQGNKFLNAAIWEAYSTAYFLRYRTEPVRNGKVNTQIAQLAKRLGSEAPEVIRFFVSHNRSYYVQKLHEVGICLSDAESLRTQWATGRTVTQRESVQADNHGATASQLQRIREGKL